jgi:hypothetical protein
MVIVIQDFVLPKVKYEQAITDSHVESDLRGGGTDGE